MPVLNQVKVESLIERLLQKQGEDVLGKTQIKIAVKKALAGEQPPEFTEEEGEPFNWHEAILFVFASVGFTKNCIDLYNMHSKAEARRIAHEKAKEAGLPDSVVDDVCDDVENDEVG